MQQTIKDKRVVLVWSVLLGTWRLAEFRVSHSGEYLDSTQYHALLILWSWYHVVPISFIMTQCSINLPGHGTIYYQTSLSWHHVTSYVYFRMLTLCSVHLLLYGNM